MTERQGLYTVLTQLHLIPKHRERLERMVREQHLDPADVISQIVADHPDPQLSLKPGSPDRYSVPVRLYLTAELRAHFDALVRTHKVDLSELVSRSVADYLETLPDVPSTPSAPQPDRADELRKRRAELNRLRARRDAAGALAPAWLNSYIADLEAEVRQLER